MIETYALLSIPLCALVTWIKKQRLLVKRLGILFLILLLGLNIYQTEQFKAGIIDGEKMTSKYYWQTFGQLKLNQEDLQYLEK